MFSVHRIRCRRRQASQHQNLRQSSRPRRERRLAYYWKQNFGNCGLKTCIEYFQLANPQSSISRNNAPRDKYMRGRFSQTTANTAICQDSVALKNPSLHQQACRECIEQRDSQVNSLSKAEHSYFDRIARLMRREPYDHRQTEQLACECPDLSPKTLRRHKTVTRSDLKSWK